MGHFEVQNRIEIKNISMKCTIAHSRIKTLKSAHEMTVYVILYIVMIHNNINNC